MSSAPALAARRVSAPARAARRLSAPPARPRHHRDITLRALRCPFPRRIPRARRPSAPTPPSSPAPPQRVGTARLVAISAPALAVRRVSAPLACPRHHRNSSCVPCTAHHRAAARAHVDLLRRRRRCRPRRSGASTLLALLRNSAPARTPRRVSAPLARHCHPVTSPRLRCAAIPAPQPESTSMSRADVAVAARAVLARRRCACFREPDAGPSRARSERTSRAPSSPP